LYHPRARRSIKDLLISDLCLIIYLVFYSLDILAQMFYNIPDQGKPFFVIASVATLASHCVWISAGEQSPPLPESMPMSSPLLCTLLLSILNCFGIVPQINSQTVRGKVYTYEGTTRGYLFLIVPPKQIPFIPVERFATSRGSFQPPQAEGASSSHRRSQRHEALEIGCIDAMGRRYSFLTRFLGSNASFAR